MKKVTLLGLSLVATMALSGVSSTLSANDKFEQLSADMTLAKSERKVVMGITELGLESKSFKFPVYYTPHGKNAKTRQIGTWSVNISQDYANSVLSDNYSFLIPSRYDKLVFDKGQAKILTATKDVTADISAMKDFGFTDTTYDAFKKEVLSYLNSEIADKITPILSAAKDARYNELPEKEQETFIVSKAKEVGMPASVLQKLISSAYTFAVYMPKMQGNMSISEHVSTDSKGRTTRYYSTSLSAPITLYMTVNKFGQKGYTLNSEVNSKADSGLISGLFEKYAKKLSGSSGVRTTYMPSEKHAQQIFDDVFKTSVKDNVLALSTKLKADRAFAISAPLDDVEGSTATLNVGCQEDIRVDHPFKVIREEDGAEALVGYMKVRKSGDNCLLLPEEKRTTSTASMLVGTAEQADLAVEHPWTGVFGSINIENSSGAFLWTNSTGSVADYETGTGAATLLNLGINGDLGYILNNPALSELWMNMSFGFGAATYDILPSYQYSAYSDTFTADGSDGTAMKFKLGVEKRFHLMSGLYVSGAVDFDYEAQSYSYENTNIYSSTDSATLSLSTMSLTPAAKVGYMFNPNLDLFASVGYNLPLGTDHTFTDSDDTEYTLGDTYDKEAGVNVMFGVNMHLNFAGPFAKMMKKPSTRCDALKK